MDFLKRTDFRHEFLRQQLSVVKKRKSLKFAGLERDPMSNTIHRGVKARSTVRDVKPHTSLSRANLDPSVSPGVDFFQYANGGWLAKHEIRADRSSENNFSEVDDR